MGSTKPIDASLIAALRLDGADLTDKNAELLRRALTHRSLIGAGTSYERLEFLGDRVLGLIVAEMLLEAFPREDEGPIAKRHAALVRKETLAEVATQIGLPAYILMSPGEESSGGRENSAITSDVCEAVIAAVYRIAGLEGAKRFIEPLWRPFLERETEPPRDAKTSLQEWLQGRGRPLPSYELVERSGPDHAPVFTIAAKVEGSVAKSATGRSKRAAEQAAAAALLAELKKAE
ncbi:ribonuclease III [Hwanghaeella sp.]|uniref:ribonuclease III n=1 Tax=Hwanghaeella sp. TaxID=2605943 RepID=UPI003CCBA634